ncbi:thioester domain-containing protein [Robertmurraya korlensis]|uniref:thioester domain-containing protein n=1 Tax=Robertmurraya korlensis TaxID=519977 RepID=UPI002041FFCE|nr:thioester domain-containing protein [Robertmurraya korlensis]
MKLNKKVLSLLVVLTLLLQGIQLPVSVNAEGTVVTNGDNPTLEEIVGDEAEKEIEALTVNEKGELMYGDVPLYVGQGDDLIPAKLDELMKKGVEEKLTLGFKIKSFFFGQKVMAASGPTIEYKGQVSYGGSIVGDFRVNGVQAFCIEHHKATPGTGTPYTGPSPYNNEQIARTLYYGWNGPGNIFGTDSARGIVVTSLVLSRVYTGVNGGGNRIAGYSDLYNHALSGSMPYHQLYFTNSNLAVNVSNGKQVSQTTTFQAYQDNSITISLPSSVTLVNESTGSSKTGGTTTIKGGQRFHLEAPLTYGGSFDTGNISGTMQAWQPFVSIPNSSGYQTLGYGQYFRDPNATVRLTAQFTPRTVTMTIQHIDRDNGSVLKTSAKTVTIGTIYNEQYDSTVRIPNAPQTVLDDSQYKTGTVPSSNFTVNFYYRSKWDLTVRYVNNLNTAQEIQTALKVGSYYIGESYSYNAPAEISYNGNIYKIAESTSVSGIMPRNNVTVTKNYDPYQYVNVDQKNMYPNNDVFNQLRQLYKVGTVNTFTAPNVHTRNGLYYDLFGNSSTNITTEYSEIFYTFNYKLRRTVTVNYLDERTGQKIIDSKTYTLHEKDSYSESPVTITKDGYTYRYIRTDGNSQSGVVGTGNIVINYYYDKPMIKTGLNKIQIYTAKKTEGLPVRVYLSKVTNYPNSNNISDFSNSTKSITVALYDGTTKISEQKFTAATLPEYLTFTIPATMLTVNTNKPYTIKLEGYNKNDFDVIQGRESLTTDGYTSSERTLEVNAKSSTLLEYKGVVMTEREVGKNMMLYYETLKLSFNKLNRNWTGYGFESPIDLQYTNEIGGSLDTAFQMEVPSKLVDTYVSYPITNGIAKVSMDKTSSTSSTVSGKFSANNLFELPHVNLEKETGYLFSDQQVQNKDSRITKTLKDGKRKFYTPIWGDLGTYPITWTSTKTIGVNSVNTKINDELVIDAYMYGHIDSPTGKQDAIYLRPINSNDPYYPENWTTQDVARFMEWNKN